MLRQEITEDDLNEAILKFPVFWWSCRKLSGYVENKEHLLYIQDNYQKSELNILDAMCEETSHSDKMYSFGTGLEHKGPMSLRDLLNHKGVDVSNINLYG